VERAHKIMWRMQVYGLLWMLEANKKWREHSKLCGGFFFFLAMFNSEYREIWRLGLDVGEIVVEN
jgi:hypothetical protein